MSRIRSVDTGPEKKLRTYLHKSGFRYRIHYPIPGKPDIVFPKKKKAIFVHGCFWHRHGCANSVMPKSNKRFWKDKLNKNVQRDKIVLKQLSDNGWAIKTVWECELEKDFERAAASVKSFLCGKFGRG